MSQNETDEEIFERHAHENSQLMFRITKKWNEFVKESDFLSKPEGHDAAVERVVDEVVLLAADRAAREQVSLLKETHKMELEERRNGYPSY